MKACFYSSSTLKEEKEGRKIKLYLGLFFPATFGVISVADTAVGFDSITVIIMEDTASDNVV